MAIEWQILGRAGADNALLATIDSGHSRERLLFDCGEGCLSGLRVASVQAIGHLCFSHFHMDHVAGFDAFFRHNYNRPDVPVEVWGPPGTLEVMAHRFRGFGWNLHRDQPGEWLVHEIAEEHVGAARFFTREAFAEAHRLPEFPRDSREIHRSANFRLEAKLLPHGTISSLAYRMVEAERKNVDPSRLGESGLAPGPWLQSLTDPARSDDETLALGGGPRRIGQLREDLLTTKAGDSLAYLTDFRVEPDSDEWADLVDWIRGTGTLVCECQYRADDEALARRHGHMTADLVGRLARDAGVGNLLLLHLSRRYAAADWLAMRDETRTFFRGAALPSEWDF
ncbi:MAG: MBL fold metallo-hydrolase [Verrucomicrobiales bacterium]